jgi:hypothetical protein
MSGWWKGSGRGNSWDNSGYGWSGSNNSWDRQGSWNADMWGTGDSSWDSSAGASSKRDRGQEEEVGSGRQLRRRSTEEGRTYDSYTHLGGDSKASLPLIDRCKIVSHMLMDLHVGMLTLNTLPGP